ncbi:hypothetical protein NM208_g13665 [Fusarium decemcellulare]|uniref:Uncharacterized protein n=1 Tax=Fusarium decemcellulare TaxID=57161 RepID=A0ACC1RIX9_9HYPO|nr:hypothetical protein NM208_g13665 [Fusarium decemcellulare]
MKHLYRLSLACLAGLVTLSAAADISYVTDLEIFTYLAPCVSSAISYNVAMQTYSTICGDSETALQKCICSTRLSEVASSISTDITYSCGSSASEDISSASKMMQKYCNQESKITFFSPTTNIVEAYITDLPELAYLPPCAQAGLSYAVVGVAASRCPEAAELNAPCVCNKKDVVHDITETLKSSVKYSCSNNQDVTSAQNFYSEFCAMNDGTTSFATPKGPPGDMSYYITALPQYRSLNKCAQSGIASAVLDQSSWLCGDGPQELASCVCIKSGMSKVISSSLTEMVKDYCDSTNIANSSPPSANPSFNHTQLPAPGLELGLERLLPLLVKQGLVMQQQPAAAVLRLRLALRVPVVMIKIKKTRGTNIVPIAGGVAGVVLIAGLGIGLFMFIRRKRQRETRGEQITNNGDGPPEYSGQPELMGNSEYIKGQYAPPVVSELSTGNAQKPELDGGKPIMELPPNHAPTAELQSHLAKTYHGHLSPQSGYVSPITPQQGQNAGWGGQPVYEFPAHPAQTHSPRPGMGYQSGPVETYELDSNVGRWAK